MSRILMVDVARAAGVSKATASLILTNRAPEKFSPATVTRVREAARKLGYFVAPDPVGALSEKRIAFCCNEPGPAQGFYGQSYVALKTICDVMAIRLDIVTVPWSKDSGRDEPATALRARLHNDRPDGAIVAGYLCESVSLLQAECIPTVMIGDMYMPDVPCAAVQQDNFRGGYLAARHLLERGHRRLAFLGYRKCGVYWLQRLAGFLQAADEWGIPAGNLVIQDTDIRDELVDNFTPRKFRAADRPTGVVAVNATLAVYFMENCRRLGLAIPEDVSLVSFDRMDHHPGASERITTVEMDLEMMGQIALRKLLACMGGDRFANTVEMTPPVLADRGSVSDLSRTRKKKGKRL